LHNKIKKNKDININISKLENWNLDCTVQFLGFLGFSPSMCSLGLYMFSFYNLIVPCQTLAFWVSFVISLTISHYPFFASCCPLPFITSHFFRGDKRNIDKQHVMFFKTLGWMESNPHYSLGEDKNDTQKGLWSRAEQGLFVMRGQN
jgi:hypothetical protein